ncbi:MAG: LPS export ABC transporter periplasmic protein LptC [Proteobacteria bacterium]|nr:LPS export ABC transporter periplasmic protein LptC [Pseudomonadota bacterium]
MNNTRQITYLFLLLIGLGFSGWLFLDFQKKSVSSQSAEENHPDAFVYNADVTRFDVSGEIASKMQVEKITHYLKNDTSHLDHPNILLYKKEQSPWQIKSNQALAERGIEKITFSKNVYLHQDKNSQNKSNTILTEQLYYYPKNEYAETDQKITVIQPAAVITSVGMQAHLKEGKVTLLSKAEGKYEDRS